MKLDGCLSFMSWPWRDIHHTRLQISLHDPIDTVVEFFGQCWPRNMCHMTYLWLQHFCNFLWISFDFQVYRASSTYSNVFSAKLILVWPKLSPFIWQSPATKVLTCFECRHFLLWTGLWRHWWSRGQQSYVCFDKLDRAVKHRLNFENRLNRFGDRRGG